jgi:hypothetical protein
MPPTERGPAETARVPFEEWRLSKTGRMTEANVRLSLTEDEALVVVRVASSGWRRGGQLG